MLDVLQWWYLVLMISVVIQEKLVAAKQTYGREIRVFETTTATISQTSNDVSGSGRKFTSPVISHHLISQLALWFHMNMFFIIWTEEADDLEFTTAYYYRI